MKMEATEERGSEPNPDEAKTQIEPQIPPPEEKNLSGIAKLIAGSRIEALKKVESGAIAVDGGTVATPGGERVAQVRDLMDDFMDLDVDAKTTASKEDIDKVKDRLDKLFARMPSLKQLDDSRAHYDEGCKNMESGKSAKALREFKVAISSAVKVCKLHADIGKALQKLKIKIDAESEKGAQTQEVKKIYERAVLQYKSGNLEEAPKLIREVAEALRSY
jgi:hypothetical protein